MRRSRLVRKDDLESLRIQCYTLGMRSEVDTRSITDHQQAMTDVLARMLRYEHAVARCSQELLVAADLNDPYNVPALTRALEHLRVGAEVDRAYFFRRFIDPELGECVGMMAEASGPGVNQQILNPRNHRVAWWTFSPVLRDALQAGQPFGGPLEMALTPATPEFQLLLQQTSDKATLCVPVHTRERWWGFIGFDDVKTVRDWDEQEVLLLSTAADMIGNALQRWHSEVELHRTQRELEERVQARTRELSERLQIEQVLAAISARLLGATDLDRGIDATLDDIGQITRASRILLVTLETDRDDPVQQHYHWHTPDLTPLTPDDIDAFVRSSTSTWLRRKLTALETVLVPDVAQLPVEARPEQLVLQQRHIQSFAILPLGTDRKLIGVLICTGTETTDWSAAPQWKVLDVIKGLLTNLLEREHLLETLEQRVTDRTRELVAFFEVTMLAGEARSLRDVLEPGLLKIMEAGRFHASCLHTRSEDGSALRLLAQQNVPQAWLPALEVVQPGSYLTDWLDRYNQPLLYHDLTEAADLPDGLHLPDGRSYLGAQLRVRGRVLGLLSCYRTTTDGISPYQVSLVAALAEQLGVVIENHRLQQQAEEVAIVSERQRLARELHDAVTQSLYSQLLFARAGRDAVEENNSSKLPGILQQLEASAAEALKEMRLLLYQLRPAALQHGRLIDAINERFDLVERRLGLQATCAMDDDVQLSADLEDMLYRVILEALNNAVKHANAHVVQVYVCRDQTRVYLAIQDDGQSFEAERAQGGMGLSNMRERVEVFDGQLEIVARPGQGTEIRVVLPWPDQS
jgi:signal transduction histidine kinase